MSNQNLHLNINLLSGIPSHTIRKLIHMEQGVRLIPRLSHALYKTMVERLYDFRTIKPMNEKIDVLSYTNMMTDSTYIQLLKYINLAISGLYHHNILNNQIWRYMMHMIKIIRQDSYMSSSRKGVMVTQINWMLGHRCCVSSNNTGSVHVSNLPNQNFKAFADLALSSFDISPHITSLTKGFCTAFKPQTVSLIRFVGDLWAYISMIQTQVMNNDQKYKQTIKNALYHLQRSYPKTFSKFQNITRSRLKYSSDRILNGKTPYTQYVVI